MAYRPMAFSLQTERLSLELRTADDAEWNLPLLREPLPLDAARARLAEQEVAARKSGIGLLTVRLEGVPIGYCGLIVGRGSLDEPELAYELLHTFRGHGYATEAASAVLEAAFDTGRSRIWSTVRTWNTASFRVLDKLGFRRERSVMDADGELMYLVLSSSPSQA